ncbi:MAG: hypothetical protein Q8Q04_03560 [archaeon]|nr:hypothetical protein [archaeon]
MTTLPENKTEKHDETRYKWGLENFIYVPSIGLHVSENKSFFGKKFCEINEEIGCEDSKLLSIFEFEEFLKYSKENFPGLYEEIVHESVPWRGEFLDSSFSLNGSHSYMEYHIFDSEKKKIIVKRKNFEETNLYENKRISIESLFHERTHLGLPTQKTEPGSLDYFPPERNKDSVSWFSTHSNGITLSCRSPASYRCGGIGARIAKLKK